MNFNKQISWHDILILLGLTVISILINGYHFEYADQEIYLAYLPVYTDANVYPQSDLLMLGKETGGNYYTFLWLILMPFFRLFGVEWTCFIVHILNIYLIYLALYYLTHRILQPSIDEQLPHKLFLKLSIPILLALVLLLTKKFVAGVSMVTIEPYLHPRNIALVLLLFAIERYLAKKPILSFCLIGLAMNIHLLSAGIVLFCILVSILIEKHGKISKLELIFGLGFILCSAPVWVWILISYKHSMSSNISSATWLSILQYRTSYLFPQLWDRLGWLAFLSILVMFTLGYYSIRERLLYRKKVIGFIVGLLILIFIGFIFSELIPIPWLIAFQTIRSIQFLIILSIILLVPYLIKLWRFDGIGKLCAVGLGIGILLFEPKTILIFLIISSIYLAIGVRLTRKLKWGFASILIVSVIIAIPFLWSRVTTKIQRHFDFSQGFQAVLQYIQIPGTVTPTPWQEVQIWAKKNSDPDSIWLTPPYLSGFRLRSQRSTIVEWKDGALGIFSPTYAEYWYQRMQDFGINVKTNVQLQPILYQILPFPELNRIAEKYHAHYIVVEQPKALPAPFLYSNSQFNVYRAVGAAHPTSLKLPRTT
ncbi:MAG: hypothetical protein L7F78_09490 [Syntrophales bacterium LBB04]|nr:hypothetical protein [Syntrophales bacterium LBB04]